MSKRDKYELVGGVYRKKKTSSFGDILGGIFGALFWLFVLAVILNSCTAG